MSFGGEDLSAVLRDYMDVTLRLQRTHETLQHEVERLRRELESKDRELERRRRLAALGEMAAGVAHEVRNPLGAIQLYSGLLRKECEHCDPAIRLIDKIESGIQAIDRVVQDTLALTPRTSRPAIRDLAEIVAEACEACGPAARSKDVALAVRIEQADLAVPAEGDGLRRVFVNLISNATDASPRGGRISVRLRATGTDGATVEVADDGPGLGDELLDRIFDPFFTTKEHGTGLGLTIAHRLVEAHGGALRARNRPEGGAEFLVTLPISKETKRREASVA